MSKYFYFRGDFIELKDLTYVNIATPSAYPFVIYSHKTKKTYLNTANGSHPFYSFFSYTPLVKYEDNTIVMSVQPYVMFAIKQGMYKDERFKKEIDALYENLTEDSNPVLFFYHLKTNL
ncbi:hypothetical protein FACS189426_04190 [Bacteroidia bacterium]|nr:hypothetical protein FACS189426_04190 [Bacteroidia bacterium]